MTTDRNSEWGSPAFYVEELRAVRDALAPSKASGVCNGAAITIEKLARRPSVAEVLALVERWKGRADSPLCNPIHSKAHRICADELAQLIQEAK